MLKINLHKKFADEVQYRHIKGYKSSICDEISTISLYGFAKWAFREIDTDELIVEDPIDMEKKYKVDKDILLYDFMYSLGKETSAPKTVMDNIRANISEVPNSDLKAYIRAITKQEPYGLGTESDKKAWLEFKEYLENELLIR